MGFRNEDLIRKLADEKLGAFGARIVEALQDLDQQHKNLTQQVNGNSTGQPQAPPTVNSLNVTAKDGIFDAKIEDAGGISRGTEYFLEYSATPNFTAPTVIHLGATRNWRGSLGNQKLYFRAYSGFSTSPASPAVYHGTSVQPIPVEGGGPAGPDLQPSAGAGTAVTNGTQGGYGYGPIPFRSATDTPPTKA